MKRIKLFSAGLLLILLAMFLVGPDSPLMGIALLPGIALLVIGSYPWARKLHWFVALAVGGVMLAASWLPAIYIPQIVKDRFAGDERNEFLVHLISSIVFWPGILFVLAGIANVLRSLRSLLNKKLARHQHGDAS